jgi:PKD repeat protein
MTGTHTIFGWKLVLQSVVMLLFSPMLGTSWAGGLAGKPQRHELATKDTLTVVRLKHGDAFRFRLKNDQVRSFVLEETTARIVERVPGGVIYSFECRLRADGQPLTLRRYVCSQETFYEPWVVNGVRIWFSSSAAIFKLVPIRYPENHDKLDADAVLAMQDATLPICPQPMQPWFPLQRHFIDVGTCYNGDDPWLGPYLGQACHVGLDINMRKGTPLFAPLDFDDHWIFSADHRWRGVRRWPNGDIWALQSHHVDRMLVKQGTALKVGTHYAEAAGKGVGSHTHSHFEFRLGEGVLNRGELAGIEVDPWILFWQIFETDRAKKGEIKAEIDPVAPTQTGQPVRCSAGRSRSGPKGGSLRYYWAFGDGGWSHDAKPEHTFVRPGVYPITLVIDDGQQRASHTQHITVNGEPTAKPTLVLDALDEVTFRPRPPTATDVYGWPVKYVPHTLRFTAAPSQANHEGPAAKKVIFRNLGEGELPAMDTPKVHYLGSKEGWLRLEHKAKADSQWLQVAVNVAKVEVGTHEAVVEVYCPGVINARQAFRVELQVRPSPTENVVVVDDKDDGCYATPFSWVGHQFLRAPQRGHKKRYLTNGGQADPEAIARFTPDLAAGRYEVRFHEATPFGDGTFNCRVRSAKGKQLFSDIAPKRLKSLSLGIFEFAEGTGGFVEILAAGSKGLVVADAVEFRRVND